MLKRIYFAALSLLLCLCIAPGTAQAQGGWLFDKKAFESVMEKRRAFFFSIVEGKHKNAEDQVAQSAAVIAAKDLEYILGSAYTQACAFDLLFDDPNLDKTALAYSAMLIVLSARYYAGVMEKEVEFCGMLANASHATPFHTKTYTALAAIYAETGAIFSTMEKRAVEFIGTYPFVEGDKNGDLLKRLKAIQKAAEDITS